MRTRIKRKYVLRHMVLADAGRRGKNEVRTGACLFAAVICMYELGRAGYMGWPSKVSVIKRQSPPWCYDHVDRGLKAKMADSATR